MSSECWQEQSCVYIPNDTIVDEGKENKGSGNNSACICSAI